MTQLEDQDELPYPEDDGVVSLDLEIKSGGGVSVGGVDVVLDCVVVGASAVVVGVVGTPSVHRHCHVVIA